MKNEGNSGGFAIPNIEKNKEPASYEIWAMKKSDGTIIFTLPSIQENKGAETQVIWFIGSIYKFETREYPLTINTTGVTEEFFIEFELIDLKKYPELKGRFQITT